MKNIRLLLLACSFVAVAATSAESARGLRPEMKPLAVVRIPDLKAVEETLDSGIGQAMGLDGQDWSVRAPGLFTIPAVRSFFAALEHNGAQEFWLCLPEMNRSAMGWRWTDPWQGNDDSLRQLGAFLQSLGLEVGRLAVSMREVGGGLTEVVISPDAKIAASLLSRPGGSRSSADQTWLAAFDAFMDKPRSGVGVWLDPQPLSGIASMLTHVDFRRLLADFGASFPACLSAWLAPRQGDVGIACTVHGLWRTFPAVQMENTVLMPGLRYSNAPALRLDLFLPQLKQFLANAGLPALPGVDLAKLAPEAVSACFWQRRTGLEWALAGKVSGDENMLSAVNRLVEWVSLLAADPDSGIRIARLEDSAERLVMEATCGPLAWRCGVRKEEGSDVYVVFAESMNSRLGLASAMLKPADGAETGASLRWTAELAPGTGEWAVAALRNAQLVGDKWDGDNVARAVALAEKGAIEIKNGDLSLESPRALALWLIPALYAALKPELGLLNHGRDDLAVGRLRFLLNLCQQIRFRSLDKTGAATPGLPTSFDAFSVNDPELLSWLDQAMPAFPGGGGNGKIMASIANGSQLDGYSYSIQCEGDSWLIIAMPAAKTLPVLRIDAQGFVTELSDGNGWRPRKPRVWDLVY